ncbi:MAG TPA: type IV pilus twitching motility protein PilT [Gemmatimonadaceae bacterium]|jgi:twitching motility protein PilT|nr:type IV pilus twitching motility protein PilT [Gemmatimonadaceae bacterium]
MAQLDRFLNLLVTNNGSALLLSEGEVASVVIKDSPRPVMKQALTSAQILTLIREIAPPNQPHGLDAKGSVTFEYTSSDGAFVVAMSQAGKLSARIERLNGSNGVKSNGSAPAATAARNGTSPGSPAAPVSPVSPVSPVVAQVPPQVEAPRAEAAATRGPVVNDRALERIENLLKMLVGKKASDLHLRAGAPPMLRASGEIAPIPNEPVLTSTDIDAMLDAVMMEHNREEFKELNDTDFAHEIAGVARFRGNALRDRKGTGAVFRAIPAAVVTVEQMGISQEVQRLCHLTKGLVLVTGPTGSGKSTTLCALIDLINRSRSDHVITIEDPIEFVHESKKCLITQRHVGVHTSSFKHALRAALREDPDIVLVGELRDLETVSMAIETAETGHLVFGTVHTSTAVSTVDRVIDQFPPDRQAQIRVMLSESLKGVISQVLCKKIGGGRVAAREIMLSTPSVSNLIREGKTFQLPSVLQTSRRLGMVTMNDALVELVDSKQVEPQEAYLKATDKVGILNMLKQRGKDVSFADPDDARAAGAASEPAGKGAGKAGAGR